MTKKELVLGKHVVKLKNGDFCFYLIKDNMEAFVGKRYSYFLSSYYNDLIYQSSIRSYDVVEVGVIKDGFVFNHFERESL